MSLSHGPGAELSISREKGRTSVRIENSKYLCCPAESEHPNVLRSLCSNTSAKQETHLYHADNLLAGLRLTCYITIRLFRVRETEKDAEKHARDRLRNHSGRCLEGRIAHQVGQTLRRVLDLHLLARAESRPPISRDIETAPV